MVRPSRTARTMVAKLSSVRTMLAASFATSVPEPIATPMSALRRAGASLTPSPVIATTCRRACSAVTIRSLCSGATRANTAMFGSAEASVASSIRSSSAPVTASPSRPRARAIAAAVARWSPVIIFTEIPALLQSSMASRASARGGSIIPTRPTNVRSVTSLVSSCFGSKSAARRSRVATARTRSPPAARRSFSFLTPCREPSSRGRAPSARENGAASFQQDPGRALHEDPHHIPVTVECGHVPAVRIERHLRDTRELGAQRVHVNARLVRERHERAFRGISDQDTVGDTAVVAEYDGPEQGREVDW